MAKTKKAKQKGNGWGVMLKSGKLACFGKTRNKKTCGSQSWAETYAGVYPGARVVRVQVVPVED